MNKKSKILFLTLSFLAVFFTVEVLYIKDAKSITDDALAKKKEFVKIVSLPDLAISTESTSVRHRSLSDTFSIYKDDGVLREYFPSSYTISHSNLERK